MAEKIGKAVITDDKGFYEAHLPTGIHATTFRGPADGHPVPTFSVHYFVSHRRLDVAVERPASGASCR
jgi:hypothetical protein